MTALLVAEHRNVHYRHATRATRKPGGRGALVFNLDRADIDHDLQLALIMTEKEAQEHFKAVINNGGTVPAPLHHTPLPSAGLFSFRWIRHIPVLARSLGPRP